MIELPMPDPANNVTVYTTGNVDNSLSTGGSVIIPVKLQKNGIPRNTGNCPTAGITTVQNNETAGE
jgi:hypothetical protein